MSTTPRFRFWSNWFALLLPSAFAVALLGVIFGDESGYERWWPVIYPLQAFVTFAIPYVVAKRIAASRVSDTRGFPVVQRPAAEREDER